MSLFVGLVGRLICFLRLRQSIHKASAKSTNAIGMTTAATIEPLLNVVLFVKFELAALLEAAAEVWEATVEVVELVVAAAETTWRVKDWLSVNPEDLEIAFNETEIVEGFESDGTSPDKTSDCESNESQVVAGVKVAVTSTSEAFEMELLKFCVNDLPTVALSVDKDEVKTYPVMLRNTVAFAVSPYTSVAVIVTLVEVVSLGGVPFNSNVELSNESQSGVLATTETRSAVLAGDPLSMSVPLRPVY